MRRFLTVGLIAGALITFCSQASAQIDGTGSVGACPAIGQLKIKPALVNAGITPAVETLKAKPVKGAVGPCPGASGDGSNVLGGKLKGTAATFNNDCFGNLLGTLSNVFVVTVKWKTVKGTPKLNPSQIMLTNETAAVSADAHGTLDASGVVTAGSFAGHTVLLHAESDQNLNEVLSACSAAGVKKLTFGVKPSAYDGLLGSETITID